MAHIGQVGWKRFSNWILRPKHLAMIEACLIGLISGLAAVLLGQAVSWLGGWRQHAAEMFPAYIVLPLIGLVGGSIAGLIVERIAPAATGSGMSEVKAVLAEVPMPLNLRIAAVKLISAALVLGCGMPLGREGPTVQIGAALANQLSRWFPTSPEHRYQLIAAGAGAGLAAAFNAPIAGVLFVVEELLQDFSGITLGSAILASFIAAVVSRVWGSHSLDLDLHLVAPDTNFNASEIPFYLLLGITAGLLGVLFNRGTLTSLSLYRRLKIALPWRIGLAGLVAGIALASLPLVFRDNAGLRQVLLTGDANWQFVAIVFAVQFVLILLTYGSGAPGGLLVPSLVLGAALGYLIGTWEHSLLGLSLPTTYARVGMAAFFCAVARAPITAVIVVFEMTTDFNLVLPLMIVSVVAYLTAENVESGSLYDLVLKFKGIHLSPKNSSSGPWIELTAADVMQPNVETISSVTSLKEALQRFSQSSHRTFPVIVEDGKLVGLLGQKDVANFSQRGLEGDRLVTEIMTVEPVRTTPNDTLAHILNLLDRYKLHSLPVVAGRRLVGIITRSDIIRVEAAYLNGEEMLTPQAAPSHLIYQTRSPETGKGRILVLVSHPQTAETLIKMAVAIARDRHYEIECLHIIVVPPHQSPAEASVSTVAAQRLLRQAMRQAQAWGVPVHTQIRVAHDLSSPILAILKERHINLVLMGWKGSTLTPGKVFSRVVDTIVRQAPCDVILVKLNAECRFQRWLIPIAGGPNAQQALKILPALISLNTTSEVKLCQVFPPDQATDLKILAHAADFLESQLRKSISTNPIYAFSVADALLKFAKQNSTDVIILGASREGMLEQAVHGNIPAMISRNSLQTVILVRVATAT